MSTENKNQKMVMGKPGKTGIARILKATVYSMKGFKAALKYEAAFRQDLLIAVILWILAPFVANSIVELLILIACPIFLLLAEILNSAIEAVVDRVGSEYHELSGRAKDMGSAAVFLMLTLNFVVWVLILINNFCYSFYN